MNRILAGLSAAALVLLFGHDALAQKAPKQAEYEFPAEMIPPVKEEYIKQCDKGQALYNLNCGACHNVKVKSSMVVPDFKLDQLEAYAIRVSNPKHESTMEETKVTAEELAEILTFLTYKKKSGQPMTMGSHKTATTEK